MSNGSGQGLERTRSDAPDRPQNFFEQTEQAYDNANDRCMSFANRIHNLSDQISGSVPQESNVKGVDAERASNAFDRCNMAQKKMHVTFDALDNAISRLEQIGLL